jgi:TolB-like protein
MLSGRPPFGGATFPAIMHAVLHETPPALVGGAAMPAVDRVIRRALSKKPADRFGSAEDLVAELRQILPLVEGSTVTAARALTRLAVLPFRLLKPDAEIEYLVLSLADVIASALAGLESLVVRPSIKTAQYANQVPDLEHVAADLAVVVVLVGSILRVGERLRVSAQLMTAPAGDTLWTHTMQLGVDAVFELHEELSQRVIDALPLTIGDQRRGPKVRPTGAKAFDLYMRGMQLRLEPGSWEQARALFDQSATLDPAFAPAWAERGRLDRVLVKYGDRARLQDAEHAFHRALEIDPDNGTTHYYQAQLEIDVGRADAALMRLVERAAKHRAEPQVYAGLVHACRYAGLLDQSIAAHLQARRLDPTVATSVLHTYYLRGDFQRALEEAYLSTDPFEARVLGAMGRRREAIDAARREEARFQGNPLLRAFCASLGDALAGDHDQALAGLRRFESSSFADGEGLFYLGEIYAAMGADDEAIAMLDRAAAAGFICVPAFLKDPYLSGLHAMRAFTNLIGRIESRQQKIAERFAKGGGARLLIL